MSSPFQGTILFDAGDFDTDEPLDTVLVRDALFGSALHKADMHGQTRASWVAIKESLVAQSETHLHPVVLGTIVVATSSTDTAWYELPCRATYTPKIRADGGGYQLRVWLAGRSSAGEQVDFAVVAVPRGAAATPDSSYPSVRFTNVTSTTIAALEPDGDPWMNLPSTFVGSASEMERAWWTKTDIGGSGTTVEVPLIEVRVFGQTWDESSQPQVFGFHLSEFVGPD
jgi:hypothetical protein